MSAPVDVLSVMDEAAYHGDGGPAPMSGDAIREARAVVAELIADADLLRRAVVSTANSGSLHVRAAWKVHDLLKIDIEAARSLCRRYGIDPDTGRGIASA